MYLLRLLLLLLTTAIAVSGWLDDCGGHIRTARPEHCRVSISRIDVAQNYTDGAEFSYKTCFVVYRTVGRGPQPVSGQIIIDTIHRMYEKCPRHKHGGLSTRGHFGTGNCNACHVTIDHQVAPYYDDISNPYWEPTGLPPYAPPPPPPPVEPPPAVDPLPVPSVNPLPSAAQPPSG
ncbi:MAG: hypothetical protein Q9193_000306 [Seirophora villosa]